MTFSFGTKSSERLAQVHPDLQRVFNEAIKNSPLDFSITEGLRTIERQKELFSSGKSQTMRSRHLDGHAVDIGVLVNGALNWDFNNYQLVADHVKSVASKLGITIEWGGDWMSFKDGPHFQLPWSTYK